MQSREVPRSDYDQALKRLLLNAHDGFLALVAPDLTWLDALPTELPAENRHADLVWKVAAPGGSHGIFHVELQTKAERDIGERLADYGTRLWQAHHLPVASLVVFLRPTEAVVHPPFVISWLGRERLRYDFDVLRLWEVPPERILETDRYELWPLAGLMGDVTVDSTIALAERIAAAPVPQHERSDLGALLFSLIGLRLPRQAVAAAFRRAVMSKNLFEDSTFPDAMRDVFLELAEAKLREEGRVEGLEKGRVEGLEKGRVEGEREAIRAVLQARFGALDEPLTQALAAADAPTLAALLAPAATESLERIRARLGLAG